MRKRDYLRHELYKQCQKDTGKFIAPIPRMEQQAIHLGRSPRTVYVGKGTLHFVSRTNDVSRFRLGKLKFYVKSPGIGRSGHTFVTGVTKSKRTP